MQVDKPLGYFGTSPFGGGRGVYSSLPRIFIGYDDSQLEAYRVLCHSIWKHASTNVEIYPLILSEFRAMGGWYREHDPLQSTEFTYLRFAVPWLCNYRGKALFIDSDMLCVGDINEVFKLPMEEKALRVVKHDHNPENTLKMRNQVQTNYPRKNWSSMMLMDCSRLTLWSFAACNEWSGRMLHRFEGIPDAQIGEIPVGWNVLDKYDENTKLIHYTEGGPWLEECKHHEFGDVWFEAQQELYGSVETVREPD